MIVWSGKGVVVPLVTIGVMMAVGFVDDALGKPAGLPGSAGQLYGISLAFALSGLVLGLLWPRLRSDPQELLDPKTNQRIRFVDRSSFFFISVGWWPYILIAIGAIMTVALMAGWRPEPSSRKAAPQSLPAPSAAPVPGRI